MIWSRKGLLVPLAMFIGFIAQISLFTLAQNFSLGSFTSRFIAGLVLLCSFLPAAINHLFTKLFLGNEISKTLYDEEGKSYQINNYSTFFFIKNKTWTKVLLIGNIILVVYTLIKMIFDI